MTAVASNATAAVASAIAERTICKPRGSHRPGMTKRFVVNGKPFRYRLCEDCLRWVDPTPIYAQERRG